MDRTLSNFSRGLEKFETALVAVACILLLAMIIITTLDVTLRYAFRAPIPGTLYYNTFLQVAVVFLGISYVQAKRGHINVGVLVSRLPARYQTLSTIIADLALALVAALIAWQGWNSAMESWYRLETALAGGIDIPIYPWRFFVPFGAGLLCLRALLDSLRGVLGVRAKQQIV